MNDRYSDLNPSAVSAALHSFPRRYRAALSADPSRDLHEMGVLRVADDRSIHTVLGETVGWFTSLSSAIGDVLVSDRAAVPTIVTGTLPPSTAGAADTDVATLLEQISVRAPQIADAIDQAPSKDLLRSGITPEGVSVTAIDLARHAVRIGADNLRAIEIAMQAAGLVARTESDDEDGDEGL